MIRVLVCGGRDYDDVEFVYAVLDEIKPAFVITGGATGADEIAEMWADERGAHLVRMPANWSTYGKAAGPSRNQQMIDEGKPNLVIAFPGGFGTANMIRRAEAAGIEVRRVGG